MGHWEQIAVENRRAREECAGWPWWRRHALRMLVVSGAAVLWVLMLAPLWRLLI